MKESFLLQNSKLEGFLVVVAWKIGKRKSFQILEHMKGKGFRFLYAEKNEKNITRIVTESFEAKYFFNY